MLNAIDCMYSELGPEDELLIYSKHVEDIYWNKLRNKVHLVGCITQIYHDARSI